MCVQPSTMHYFLNVCLKVVSMKSQRLVLVLNGVINSLPFLSKKKMNLMKRENSDLETFKDWSCELFRRLEVKSSTLVFLLPSYLAH